MKKHIILSSTKLSMYLTELPLVVLLILTIRYNPHVTTPGKLYPLIVTLIIGMLFIYIYLFRLVMISTDEVRSIGRFSSRDSATLNEGKTLILTLLPRRKMRVEVFGNDGTPPALDWAQNEDYEIADIFLYRERAVGTRHTVARILEYFEVPKGDAQRAPIEDGFFAEYDFLTVSTEIRNELTEVKIRFTKTV